MSERVRLAAMAKLRERTTRLVNMLNNPGTPMSLLAFECGLIGDLEPCLDPAGSARRMQEDETRHAKRNIGVCVEPGCEADSETDDGLCADHEAEFLVAYAANAGRPS